MWFKLTGDERLGRCATDRCGGQPTERLEVDGIGANYCSGCRARIISTPEHFFGLRRVYFIRVDGFIKIGYSDCPEKRLMDIQTCNPHEAEMLAAVPGDREVEQDLHTRAKFIFLHERGEWYRQTPKLLAYIERCKNADKILPLISKG